MDVMEEIHGWPSSFSYKQVFQMKVNIPTRMPKTNILIVEVNPSVPIHQTTQNSQRWLQIHIYMEI